MKTTNIAIVGLGGMGNVHYENWKHIEGANVVVAVGSCPADEARAKQWGVPFANNLKEATEKADFSVVDICTPTFLHVACVKEALNLKKQCISEKPLALSSKDAQELFDLAKQNNVHLYVAQVLQFTKAVEILRALVKEKTYGKVKSATFLRLSAFPSWSRGGWLTDKSKSGLIPFDLHIHDLDVIISLFGKPESAQAVASGNDHYTFTYRWSDKDIVAEAAWYPAEAFPFTATWRVAFEHAVAVNEGDHVTIYPEKGEPIERSTKDEIVIPTGINVPPTGWYYTELSHFLSCIEQGKPSPVVSEEQVIDTLTLLESMGL